MVDFSGCSLSKEILAFKPLKKMGILKLRVPEDFYGVTLLYFPVGRLMDQKSGCQQQH
jgi:hypothetical protein